LGTNLFAELGLFVRLFACLFAVGHLNSDKAGDTLPTDNLAAGDVSSTGAPADGLPNRERNVE
jgi:hypothetical protein